MLAGAGAGSDVELGDLRPEIRYTMLGAIYMVRSPAPASSRVARAFGESKGLTVLKRDRQGWHVTDAKAHVLRPSKSQGFGAGPSCGGSTASRTPRWVATSSTPASTNAAPT
jgi:hypothetical protein